MPRFAEPERLRPHGIADRRRVLEITAVFVLALIFIAVAVQRIWSLRAVAERAAVEHMISTLRTALALRIIENIASGEDLKDIATLANSNPMLLLDPAPPNYLGELDHPEAEITNGHCWYFDATERTLVYVVGSNGLLSTGQPPTRIRWRVQVAAGPSGAGGKTGKVRTIDLRPVEPYRWKTPEDWDD